MNKQAAKQATKAVLVMFVLLVTIIALVAGMFINPIIFLIALIVFIFEIIWVAIYHDSLE